MSFITIGEVARRSGVAASALRYYEERGLITSHRTGAGHRRFPRAVLRLIDQPRVGNSPARRIVPPSRRSLRRCSTTPVVGAPS